MDVSETSALTTLTGAPSIARTSYAPTAAGNDERLGVGKIVAIAGQRSR